MQLTNTVQGVVKDLKTAARTITGTNGDVAKVRGPYHPEGTPPYISEKNPARKKYKKPDQLLQNPDAIIIGSGIGGMSLGSILAQRKGWKVLLLEANALPGGCTHCKEVGGFEWNTGIDSIGDMDSSVGRGMYRPTIDYITGGKLEWAKMPDIHEISYFGDDRYDWYSSPEKNIEWVERMFPGSPVRDYYKLESTVEWWAWAWAVTKVWPEWVPVQLREMVYAITGGAWRKYMKRKTEDIFVNQLGFSPKLAAIFSYMYGNHGRTPAHSPFAFHAVNLQHFSNGSYYPVGGPAQFANTIIPIIEEAGGQLAVQTPVRRILVEGNKAVGVEVNSGEQIRAPVVISACGAHTTFMELLPRHVAERHGYPEKFEQIKPSVAHVYMFLGYDEHIELPKEIIWQIPGYDIEKIDRQYKDDMDLEIMGAYLLCPSARDPVFAQRYPNKSTVIALAEAPYAWVEKCKRDPEFKKSFEERLGRNLEKIILKRIPQLQGKTPAYRKAGVPIGCNPYAWQASSLGLEPSGERFTDHTHWLRPKTKVDNLYLTGQDSFSAGFCGSMFSGRLTYAAMTGNYAFLLRKSIGVFP